MSEDTTIPLKKVTRDRLRTYGMKGATWDKLLNDLMDEVDTLNAAITDVCLEQMRRDYP